MGTVSKIPCKDASYENACIDQTRGDRGEGKREWRKVDGHK